MWEYRSSSFTELQEQYLFHTMSYHLRICYNVSTLKERGILILVIALWKHNNSTGSVLATYLQPAQEPQWYFWRHPMHSLQRLRLIQLLLLVLE